MSRALDVSILVRLVDRVTAPLRALQRAFERFAGLAQKIGVLGAAVAAISFMTLIQQAAAFDQKLRDMVVTAGQFGQQAENRIRQVKGELFDLALQVGLTADALTGALSAMTAAGMDDALANRLLPTIGRVAKAASALPEDVARVGFELSATFGIAADQLEANFAKLVTAGKLGRFEFRDMAKAIPTLSNALAGLGVTGTEAVAHMGAALQVAMLGADSAATAANNYKNFLDKVLAPDAIKNFEEAGVSIERVMKNAVAKGINPVEAALESISRLTKANQKEIDSIFKAGKAKGMTDAQAAEEVKKRIMAITARTKLGELFADSQVLNFLVPFMLNKQKFKEMKAAIQAAGLDEMARDFKTQMAGLGTQLTIFNQVLDIFKDRVGIAFGSNLGWMNDGLIKLMGWVKQVDAAFPGLIDKVLTFGGGALVLVTALGLLAPVFSVVAAGIGILLSPIVLLAAAFAGVALIIYSDWEGFAPFFTRIWEGVKQAFGGAVDFVKALFSGDWAGMASAGLSILEGLGKISSGVMSILGRLLTTITEWALNQLPAPWREGIAQAVAVITTGFDQMVRDVQAFGARIGTAAGEWAEAGRALIQNLWDGAKEQFEALLNWVRGIPGWIRDAIGNIDLTSIIKWPTLPWGGGGPAAPAGANDNAPAAAPQKQSFAPTPGKQMAAAGFASPAALGGSRAAGAASPQAAEVSGRIVVEAAPGTRVREAASDTSSVSLVAGQGQVIGRA